MILAMTEPVPIPSDQAATAGPGLSSGTRDAIVIDWPDTFWFQTTIVLAMVLIPLAMFMVLLIGDTLESLGVLAMLMVSVLIVAAIMITLGLSAAANRLHELQEVFDAATLAVARHHEDVDFDWGQIEGAPSQQEVVAAILQTRFIERGVNVDPGAAMRMLFRDLHDLRIPTPAVVVDRRVEDDLAAVAMTTNLLEPEPARSRWNHLALCVDGGLFLFVIAVFVFGTGHAARIAVPCAVLPSLFIRRFGILRLFLRHGLHPGDSGLIAGVGYIERHDGSRTGSWQAITLVSKGPMQPLRVRICTLQRVEDLRFTSARDPGFIAFWQRWNHPHPRPELLGDPAAT